MKATIYGILLFVLAIASVAFADGYLDISKDSTVKSPVHVQTISPVPSNTYTYTGVSGKASARPLVNTSAMKMIGFQATDVNNAAIPVSVYFCTGTTIDTCGSHYMIYPGGGGTVAVGASTKSMAFGVISSATVNRKISVMGR